MDEPVGTAKERHSEQFFDRWATNYDDMRIAGWFQYTQAMALDAFDLRPDSRLLDVGCGTGQAVLRAAVRLPEGRACGIDISEQMIEKARANTPSELAKRIEFRQASSSSIPYEDGSFTQVLCTNSFHHYPDPLQVLGEFRRVLTPGGQLVIFENAPDLSWYTWLWDRFLRVFERGHVRYYPSAELGAMIERAGYVERELVALRSEFRKHGKLFASFQIWRAVSPVSYSQKRGCEP